MSQRPLTTVSAMIKAGLAPATDGAALERVAAEFSIRMTPAMRAAAHTGSAGRLRGRKEGRGRINMDIAVGDTILTRKKHPCGASSFEVLRVGMDFKIRCTGCGREVMLPRAKIEKNIKKVVKPGSAQ